MSNAPIHATAVALSGKGVLLIGPSGAGKSDLALRLIDRGAVLVADDRVHAEARDGVLLLSAPPAIAGLIEVRGVGIIRVPSQSGIPASLVVDLGRAPERFPEPESHTIAGIALPLIRLAAKEASAPLKLERALALLAKLG